MTKISRKGLLQGLGRFFIDRFAKKTPEEVKPPVEKKPKPTPKKREPSLIDTAIISTDDLFTRSLKRNKRLSLFSDEKPLSRIEPLQTSRGITNQPYTKKDIYDLAPTELPMQQIKEKTVRNEFSQENQALPKGSTLRELILSHPSNEPLPAAEWARFIFKGMKKAPNKFKDPNLKNMDMTVKELELRDSNLMRYDFPETSEGIKAQQRLQQLRKRKDDSPLEKDLYERALEEYRKVMGKPGQQSPRLTGGFLRALHDQGKTATKDDLLEIVENNPLYKAQVTHFTDVDNLMHHEQYYDGIDAYASGMKGLFDSLQDFKTILNGGYRKLEQELGPEVVRDYNYKDLSRVDSEVVSNFLSLRNKVQNAMDEISPDLFGDNSGLQELGILDRLNFIKLRSNAAENSPYTEIQDGEIKTLIDNLGMGSFTKIRGTRQLLDELDQIVLTTRALKNSYREASRDPASIYSGEDLTDPVPEEITTDSEDTAQVILDNVKTLEKKARKLFESIFKSRAQNDKNFLSPYRNFDRYNVYGANNYGSFVVHVPKSTNPNLNSTSGNHYGKLSVKEDNVPHVDARTMAINSAEALKVLPSDQNKLLNNQLYFARYDVRNMDDGNEVALLTDAQMDRLKDIRNWKAAGLEKEVVNPYNLHKFPDQNQILDMSDNNKLDAYLKKMQQGEKLSAEAKNEMELLRFKLLTNAITNEPIGKAGSFANRDANISLDKYLEKRIPATVRERNAQGELVSEVRNVSQKEIRPYLPLETMQSQADHTMKTFMGLISQRPGITHIGVHPAEFMEYRSMKQPYFDLYGSKEGLATDTTDMTAAEIKKFKRESAIFKAMKKISKDYNTPIEDKLVAKSRPSYPHKIIKVDFVPKPGAGLQEASNYVQHKHAFKTQEEAESVLKSLIKLQDSQGATDNVTYRYEYIPKDLANGKPNPRLYDKYKVIKIPEKFLALPKKGYLTGGLVNSGFKW